MSEAITHMAIAKCGRVLCAFAHFYFPFYGRQPRDVFWHFDPFAIISASLYDVDEEIEHGRAPGEALARLSDLTEYLNRRITLDPFVLSLFDDARRYYLFEHNVSRRDGSFSLEELSDMTSARSFDFRIMHRTLAQTTGLGYREPLFDWFRAFERLMEIDDDIASTVDDEQRNTFNVLALAKRCAPDKALPFVEDLRQQAENDVTCLRTQLSQSESAMCDQVVEVYREIVPRPPLGSS